MSTIMAVNVTEAASCERYAMEAPKATNNAKTANWTRMAFLPTGMRRFVTTVDNRTAAR